MALKFNCPKCAGPIIVKYLKLGETAKCLKCQAEVLVPADALTTDETPTIEQPGLRVDAMAQAPIASPNEEIKLTIKNRKELLPAWIRFFSWIFLIFLISPLTFVFFLFLGHIDISLFGYNYSGPAWHPAPIIAMAIMTFNGIAAYGLLWGRRWGVKAGLICGIVGGLTSISSVFMALLMLSGRFDVTFIVQIFFVRALFRVKEKWEGITDAEIKSNQPELLAGKSSWWSRNWKWCAPAIALTAVIIIGLAIFVFTCLIMGTMKRLEPYQVAVESAQNNRAVANLFEGRIEPGWYVLGNFKVSPSTGHASLQIPISSGSKTGKIYIESVKTAGVWTTQKLVVEETETGQRLNLIDANGK